MFSQLYVLSLWSESLFQFLIVYSNAAENFHHFPLRAYVAII